MPKVPPYSEEFKREAVQLLRSSGRPIPQLAKELGVSPQSRCATGPRGGLRGRRGRRSTRGAVRTAGCALG